MSNLMQGENKVEVLFPDFKMPKTHVRDEGWAALAFKLHAELDPFPTSGRLMGSVHGLLEELDGTPSHSLGRREIFGGTICDQECGHNTRGMAFAHCGFIGKLPQPNDWLGIENKGGRMPRRTNTIHLLMSKAGFFFVAVQWNPRAEWKDRLPGEPRRLKDCWFNGSPVVVTSAGPYELASFFKKARAGKKPDAGAKVVQIIEAIQRETVYNLHQRHVQALRRLHRIEGATTPLSL